MCSSDLESALSGVPESPTVESVAPKSDESVVAVSEPEGGGEPEGAMQAAGSRVSIARR